MALELPGERKYSALEIVLAIAAVVGIASLGCASSGAPPVVARPVASAGSSRAPAAPVSRDEGAAFVTTKLQKEGLRFGTDGSARSLWGYLSLTHRVVAPASARPGDVLFFETRGPSGIARCDAADHAGLIESIAPDGRITFVEARGGRVRRSFVDPVHPTQRRNTRGEIANSFLRAKQVDDPDDAHYFAGQLLCGVARTKRK
jgi:hypothetical protein